MSRKLRLAQSLRRLVSEALQRDVRDARLEGAMVSVASVELNADMSVATVWVSMLGEGGKPDQVMAALASAAPFMRRIVGQNLQIRQAPELRFLLDTSPEFSVRLRGILLDDERKAREAGREPGATAAPAEAATPAAEPGADATKPPA
ncbi:MAG: 30S ribosome-binding factor RbfA [Myxococcales bacterium]|nr:30S ribosome-binding factor RbfA [Myxococcales bacterium]